MGLAEMQALLLCKSDTLNNRVFQKFSGYFGVEFQGISGYSDNFGSFKKS